MQRFFSSLVELDLFTQSLDSLNSNQTCQHCGCAHSWVSHGFIYRQSGLKVGKRILCAKRYGKAGCGRTLALYLADVIPNRRYSVSVIWAFVLSLLQGSTVEQAYYSAIGHCHFSHRQAYRWLSALYAQLGLFRSWLARFNSNFFACDYVNFRSARLAVLLPTMANFSKCFTNISSIQARLNCRFC